MILMIHGNPTWSYFYRRLISSLRSQFRIIALDHIGCGLSDKPAKYPYTLEQHIENLEKLIDNLGVDRFSLVTHDWGGAIGVGAAVNRVESVESLVVMNTAAFRSKRIPLRIGVCKIPVLGEIIVRLFNGFAWPATFMAVTKKMETETVKAYLAPYNNWANRIAVHRFVQDIPLRETHKSYNCLKSIEDRLPQLEALDIPMLIAWGGKDFCFNDHFFEQWKARFPTAETHYLKDAGHYLLEDEPIKTEEIIRNFFTRKLL